MMGIKYAFVVGIVISTLICQIGAYTYEEDCRDLYIAGMSHNTAHNIHSNNSLHPILQHSLIIFVLFLLRVCDVCVIL